MTIFPTTAAAVRRRATFAAIAATGLASAATLRAQSLAGNRAVPPPDVKRANGAARAVPPPASTAVKPTAAEKAAAKAGRYVVYDTRLVRRDPRLNQPGGTIITLSGDVKFLFEDTTLRTDIAALNEKTQVATSPGALRIDDSQNTITASQGVAYYKKRLAEFTGNVRIIARPRPQDKNAPEGSLRREFKDPVTVLCENGQYNWRRKLATLTGGLTFKQKKRTLTADKAIYDGRAETLKLIGNVRGVDNGADVRAANVLIGLKEGAEFLEISGSKDQPFVQGRFPVEDDEENKPGEEETPEAAPDPAGAPAVPAPAPVGSPR